MAEECTHECSSCGESGCSDRTAQGPSTIETNSRSNIKHVIGVVSGKGGVGKSLVTSYLPAKCRSAGRTWASWTRRHRTVHPETFGITNPLTADATASCPARRKAASR